MFKAGPREVRKNGTGEKGEADHGVNGKAAQRAADGLEGECTAST